MAAARGGRVHDRGRSLRGGETTSVLRPVGTARHGSRTGTALNETSMTEGK